MIDSKDFLKHLQNLSVNFFTGVPDSLLKDLCACIADNVADAQHVPAANEGGAVALAAGYHLATGDMPLVYLQNSGLGNAVNPLLSLADPEVYGIPMMLVIGWRGKPGVKDEPQHIKQGRVQHAMLDSMEVPYRIIHAGLINYRGVLQELITIAHNDSRPVALIVEKDTFADYPAQKEVKSQSPLRREEALQSIISHLKREDIVVSTTGKASREIYEIRAANKQGHHSDFLSVGSMGHCSQIALGISLVHNNKTVVCIDGDGALIMHMGAMSIIGARARKNFIHILLNNHAHDSVGGQPTTSCTTNFCNIAISCGYKKAYCIKNIQELGELLPGIMKSDGPVFIEIIVQTGARKDLGRPGKSPRANKYDFMAHLKRP